MRERIFWDQVGILSGFKGQKATADQFQILRDTIENIFDDRKAGEFTKLCAALKSSDLPSVARAIHDLEKHHWFHEIVLTQEKDQKTEKIPPTNAQKHRGSGARYRFLYGFEEESSLSRHHKKSAQTRTALVDRYIPQPELRQLFPMDIGLKVFLTDNFLYLSPRQKEGLLPLLFADSKQPQQTPRTP